MKRIQIKIDKPCAENWDSFEKRGLNGFCQSCEKEVVDFTRMTDNEIKKFFLKPRKGVCGRLRINQQKIYAYPDTSKFSFKPIVTSLVAGSAVLFSAPMSFGQNMDRQEQTTRKLSKKDSKLSDSKKRTIHGIISDDSGETLPGCNIVIKGTTTGTTSDSEGKYSIVIQEGVTLVYSFVGFETQEVEIGTRSTIDITMSGMTLLGETVMTGGISTRWYTPRGLWIRTKSFFLRLLP